MRAKALMVGVMAVVAVAMLGWVASADAAMWTRVLGDQVDCSASGACCDEMPAVWCCEGGELTKCFVGLIPGTLETTFGQVGACLVKDNQDVLVEGVMDYRDSGGHGYGRDARLGACPEGYERMDATTLPCD